MAKKILHFVTFIASVLCFICALGAGTSFNAALWGTCAGMWLDDFIKDFFE